MPSIERSRRGFGRYLTGKRFKLDRSHPLYSGLRIVFIPQLHGSAVGFLNLVTEQWHPLANGVSSRNNGTIVSTGFSAQYGYANREATGQNNAYIDTGIVMTNGALAAQFTATAIVKHVGTSSRNNIWGSTANGSTGHNWFLRFMDSAVDVHAGTFKTGYIDNTYTPGGTFSSSFHHVGMRFSPTTQDLTVDGVIQATASGTTLTLDAGVSFMYSSNQTDPFSGIVEGGWLWERALTDLEMQAHYSMPWDMLVQDTRRHFTFGRSDFAYKIREGGTSATTASNARKNLDAAGLSTIAAGYGLTGGAVLRSDAAIVTLAADPLILASQTDLGLKADKTTGLTASEGVQRVSGTTLAAAAALKLDVSNLTEDTSPSAANDFVATWDASASLHKKVKLTNLPSAGLTVEEIDGAPSVANVTKIKVTNAKLTDNTGGVCTLDLSGAGGGSGNVTTTGAYASIPSAGGANGASGDIYLPSDTNAIYRSTGSVWEGWVDGSKIVDPLLQTWTWQNQGSATVDTSKGGIYLSAPASASNNVRIYEFTPPSPPYKVTCLVFPLLDTSASAIGCGLGWKETGTGKMTNLNIGIDATLGANHLSHTVYKWTNPITFSTAYFTALALDGQAIGNGIWLQIEDDNTNRICRISNNKVFWIQTHTVSRTDFLTPARVFIECNSANSKVAAAWFRSIEIS